jgi:acetyl esterase
VRERKTIDPALRAYLDGLAAATAAPGALNDGERAALVRGNMLRNLAGRGPIPGLPNDVTVQPVAITPTLGANLYTSAPGGRPLPILVYLHGGGWVAGSAATHDPFCRLLSAAAEVIVLSVDYRLAPEHRYPAAVEDTLAAVHWAIHHAASIGGDPARIAIGGDSAGGNLAAVAGAQLCPTTDAIRALMLLYPVTDHYSANHASWMDNATGYGLEAGMMRWYWDQYAPGVSSDDAAASPLRLEPTPALPPTLVTTAEYDVLRDEGIAYAEKLRTAGVDVTHMHSADMHHNFFISPGTVGRFPQCESAFAAAAGWLKEALAITA